MSEAYALKVCNIRLRQSGIYHRAPRQKQKKKETHVFDPQRHLHRQIYIYMCIYVCIYIYVRKGIMQRMGRFRGIVWMQMCSGSGFRKIGLH